MMQIKLILKEIQFHEFIWTSTSNINCEFKNLDIYSKLFLIHFYSLRQLLTLFHKANH